MRACRYKHRRVAELDPPKPFKPEKKKSGPAGRDLDAYLNRFSQYKPNPRHVDRRVLSVADAFTLAIDCAPGSPNQSDGTARRAVSRLRRFGDVCGAFPFRPSPAVVVFDDIAADVAYRCIIEFQNVSPIGRRLRILPPCTGKFSVSELQYPVDGDGGVAPGLICSCVVSFMSSELRDANDCIVLQTDNPPKVLQLRLHAVCSKAKFDLPPMLDCGLCFMSAKSQVPFRCTNKGGHSRCIIVPADDDDADALPRAVKFDPWPVAQPSVCLGDDFSISPVCFELGAKAAIDLTIEYTPLSEGRHQRSFWVVCENGEQFRYYVCGQAEVPRLSLVELGGQPPVLSGESDELRLDFESVPPSAKAKKSSAVRNNTALPVRFRWAVEESTAPAGKIFKVVPPSGELGPGEQAAFSIEFTPLELKPYSGVATLWMCGVPVLTDDSDAVPAVEDRRALSFCLESMGCSPNVELLHPVLIWEGQLQVNCSYQKATALVNRGVGDAAFSVEFEKHEWVDVEASPATGIVKAGSKLPLNLRVLPKCPGRLQIDGTVDIRFGPSFPFTVSPIASPPRPVPTSPRAHVVLQRLSCLFVRLSANAASSRTVRSCVHAMP